MSPKVTAIELFALQGGTQALAHGVVIAVTEPVE
jgi:hypothetical protein